MKTVLLTLAATLVLGAWGRKSETTNKPQKPTKHQQTMVQPARQLKVMNQ